jgi:hypothetical protein
MNWLWWVLIIISPFLIYLFFRLMFGALFKSYFEAKQMFLNWCINFSKKERKNGI